MAAGLGRDRAFAWLAARARFFDGAVTEALDAGIRQVVVLGPVEFGVKAASTSGSRTGAAFHSLSLRLSGEHINFRPTAHQAAELLTTTGWTPQGTRTAPELIRHYLTGSVLPTTDLEPTAFAMTATTAGAG